MPDLSVVISVGAVFLVIGIAAGIMINNYIQKLQKDSAHRNVQVLHSYIESAAQI